MPRLCHRCGTTLKEQDAFCSACGTPASQNTRQTISAAFYQEQTTRQRSEVSRAPNRRLRVALLVFAALTIGLSWLIIVIINFAHTEVAKLRRNEEPTLIAKHSTSPSAQEPEAASSPVSTSPSVYQEPQPAVSHSEDHKLHEDGRVYSVALIVATAEIPSGAKLFAQGRVLSFDYADAMRSRRYAIIEDEQQPGKTLMCAMSGEEGVEVFSLYHVGEVVAVSGEYLDTVGVNGYPRVVLTNCHVAGPQDNVVRPAPPTNDKPVRVEQPPQTAKPQPQQPQQPASPEDWLRSRGFGNTQPAQTPSAPKSNRPERDGSVSPQTVELPIDGSNCFYLSTDFDTGLPLNDARVCVAESRPQMTTGEKVTFVLSCDARLATCMQLSFGQTYEAEVVNNNQYPECGKASEKTGCVKVHARPYDLIYKVVVRIDCNDKANQSPGSAAYEDCKGQK